MMPDPKRVATRALLGAVQIEVLEDATQSAQSKYGDGIAVGKFLTHIPLYRVFDGEELRNIMSTGNIVGGNYSVEGERAFGAQWGSDLHAVAKWGEKQRGKRLGHELFIAEIDGFEREFAHLSGADGKMTPGVVQLDESFCNTGLGCSICARLQDVVRWFIVENGNPIQTTKNELDNMASSVGLKPRQMQLYKGGIITKPLKLVKALRYSMYDTMYDLYDVSKMRSLGVKLSDEMPKDMMGPIVVRSIAAMRGGWYIDSSSAWQSVPPSTDRELAVVVCITATVAVPQLIAPTPDEAHIRYVDLRLLNGKTKRIWQPWDGVSMRLLG